MSADTPRALGFWTAVAIVMGNMIGSGVFLLPASLAPFGGLGLGGWILSTAGATLLALVFARLSRFHPAAGGLHAFTRLACGDLAGFLVAWGCWISVWCANAAIAVAFVGYLDPFFPSIVRNPASAAMVAVGAVWVLTAVNALGVRSAGRVQLVTTISQGTAAGADRHRRHPVPRPLALRGSGNRCRRHRTRPHRERDAHLVGVSRSRVRDDPGHQHRQSRTDDSTRDGDGHAARLGDLRGEHRGGDRAARPVYRPTSTNRPPKRRLLAVDVPDVCPIRRPGVFDGLTPLRLVP